MSAAHSYLGSPWTRPLLSPQRIHQQLRDRAWQYGDRTCLIEIDRRGAEASRITYRALLDAITERAAWLRRELGDRVLGGGLGLGGTAPGVDDADAGSGASAFVVGVPMSNTVDALIDLLAVLDIGATAVVVDAAEPESRREDQFALLCDAVIQHSDAGRTLRRQKPAIPADTGEAHPTAFVLYTTGSTAASKPVAQSHYAVLVNVWATIRHHGMQPGEVMACALPISHVNGLHFGVLATLLSGGTCVLFHQFDVLGYLRTLRTYGVQRATTVPSLLQVLSELRQWPALPDLRYLVSAAAPLAPTTAAAVYGHGHRIVQGYGLSECMNFATTMPTGLTGAAYERAMLGTDIPPVGLAVYGCEVAILDPDGTALAAGATGEVGIRGHSLMSRYLGDDAATDVALGSGWLRTGDIGRLDIGEFAASPLLTLVGRQKNVAKCNGLSISLEEIDRWLAGHQGIREACSVARPDPYRGDAVTVLYVPGAEGAADAESVADHVRLRFDSKAIGLELREVEQLPRLRNGKLDRRAMAALIAG
jgi:acyl-CoA synthetase (AMP-forming)/AMP-acid ligase II